MGTYEYTCRKCRKKFCLVERIPATGGDPECAECIAGDIMKAVFDAAKAQSSNVRGRVHEEMRNGCL